MPTINAPHIPSRRKVAFRVGKTVAKSPRGRHLAIKAGKTVAKSPQGRRAVAHVARKKAGRPLALILGASAAAGVIAAFLLRDRSKPESELS